MLRKIHLLTFSIFSGVVFGQTEKILTNDPSEDRYASYSPDGTKILFESNRNGNWDIFLMDADGENQKPVTSDTSQNRRPSWHPSGKKILFESNRNGVNRLYELNVKNLKAVEIAIEGFDGTPIFARYSPDGNLIAFSASVGESEPNLYLVDSSGKNLRQVTSYNFRSLYPDWSPDGKRLVFFSRHETNNEDDEIYTINLDGSEIERLTNWPKHNFCPRWSPDGRKIAYVTSMEVSRPEIYVMDSNGENQQRITNNTDGDTLPSWSLDGTKLLVTGFRNGNYEICEVILNSN